MRQFRYVASDRVQFDYPLQFPPRRIAHHRFLYVESGRGEFRISTSTFPVRSGWLGLLGPGFRESQYFAGEEVSYLFVEFASNKALMPDHCLECHASDPQRTALIWLLKSIASQQADPRGELLAAAVQLVGLEEHNSESTRQIDGRLLEVMRLVQKDPAANPTVSELAAQVGLSEPHLRRLFRSQLETSPKQFLLRTRMEYAWRLLRFEGLRVSEVANLLGFATLGQFSAQYHQVMGRAPSEDRPPT